MEKKDRKLVLINQMSLKTNASPCVSARLMETVKRIGVPDRIAVLLTRSVNRGLQIECTIGHCPTGKKCTNNRFQKQLYPKLEVFTAGGKGNGIRANEAIHPGQFVIEYVGEIILIEDCAERMKDQRHFYFLTLDAKRGIDASQKGNLARYINHSCDPNCATRKWHVNGETRVGIFALTKIRKGQELTFDYQFERIGGAKQKCLCGSENCRGYLGAKAVEEARPEKHTTTNHKKHVSTLLKNINYMDLDLALEETASATIRNRSGEREPIVFLQRNYRKTCLAHLTNLQLSFIEKYNATLEELDAKEHAQKQKQDANSHIRRLSLGSTRAGKKLSFAEVATQHAALGVRNRKAVVDPMTVPTFQPKTKISIVKPLDEKPKKASREKKEKDDRKKKRESAKKNEEKSQSESESSSSEEEAKKKKRKPELKSKNGRGKKEQSAKSKRSGNAKNKKVESSSEESSEENLAKKGRKSTAAKIPKPSAAKAIPPAKRGSTKERIGESETSSQGDGDNDSDFAEQESSSNNEEVAMTRAVRMETEKSAPLKKRFGETSAAPVKPVRNAGRKSEIVQEPSAAEESESEEEISSESSEVLKKRGRSNAKKVAAKPKPNARNTKSTKKNSSGKTALENGKRSNSSNNNKRKAESDESSNSKGRGKAKHSSTAEEAKNNSVMKRPRASSRKS